MRFYSNLLKEARLCAFLIFSLCLSLLLSPTLWATQINLKIGAGRAQITEIASSLISEDNRRRLETEILIDSDLSSLVTSSESITVDLGVQDLVSPLGTEQIDQFVERVREELQSLAQVTLSLIHI